MRKLVGYGLSFQVIHPTRDGDRLRPADPETLAHRKMAAMLFLERADSLD